MVSNGKHLAVFSDYDLADRYRQASSTPDQFSVLGLPAESMLELLQDIKAQKSFVNLMIDLNRSTRWGRIIPVDTEIAAIEAYLRGEVH